MPNAPLPSGQPLPGWGQKLRNWPAKTSRTAVALATLAGLALSSGAHPAQGGHAGNQTSDTSLQGDL